MHFLQGQNSCYIILSLKLQCRILIFISGLSEIRTGTTRWFHFGDFWLVVKNQWTLKAEHYKFFIKFCNDLKQYCNKSQYVISLLLDALVNHTTPELLNSFQFNKLNSYNAWDVIYNNCCCCTTVVYRSQTMISFLSCCVPYVKLHSSFR